MGTIHRFVGKTWIFVGSLILVLHSSADQKRSRITDSGISETVKIEAQTLEGLLSNINYNRAAVKPSDYADIIGDFMRSLDGARIAFVKSDELELVKTYGRTLQHDLTTGDLRAALGVTERYRSRVSARAAWIQHILAQPFSVTLGETGPRMEFEWPEDTATADARWLTRLHAEIVDELLNGVTIEEAQQNVKSRYEKWQVRVEARQPADAVDHFLNAVAQRYDAQSAFFSAATFGGNGLGSDSVGIGALLAESHGRIYVQEVLRRGPSDKPGGLTAGDLIVKIQHRDEVAVDVVGMNLNEVVSLLRGKPGTDLTVTVHPGNLCDPAWRRSASLTRSAVDPTGARAYSRVFLAPTTDGNNLPIGVVILPAFYGQLNIQGGAHTDASRDLTDLVRRLSMEKIAGLVLDLRGNGGGVLEQAINVAGLFVGHRAIIRTRNGMAEEIELVSPVLRPIYDGPMVVLVDDRSAAAAEIVAGALRDYGRALVVGSRTHGNGTVQQVLELRSLVPALARSGAPTAAVKFTMQQFFLPNGDSPQLSGVDPDIALPSVNLYAPEEAARHPIPAQKCAPFAQGAKKIPTDLIKRLVEQSQSRQANISDLVAARRLSNHLRDCRAGPVTLEIATRHRQMAEEQDMASNALSHPGNSQEQMACRLIFPDANNADAGGDHAQVDSATAEVVRIVRDAVEAKWMPEFN
jgi:carboxyl-terminal processing protease